jgi:hypothetical protein
MGSGWVWEGGWIPVAAWTRSTEDAIEAKMALPIMLHGLRAKGSAAALMNSKKPMWPVAEFSRSHVLVPWSPDGGEFLNLNLKALALIYGYPCK